QAEDGIRDVPVTGVQTCALPISCGPELALPAEAHSPDSMEFYGKLSFLKAGIVYASHITTVSQTYAREITTEAFGCGLQGVLKQSGRASGRERVQSSVAAFPSEV